MRALLNRRSSILSLASGALIALAVLAPTGAEAVPFSLHATSADSVVTSSCDFTVTRVNQNTTGEPTVTAKVVLKAAEIKPSVFSPRKVANLNAYCDVFGGGGGFDELLAEVNKFNNASTAYKAKYLTLPYRQSYQVCVTTYYTLKNGTSGNTPQGACDPPV
jgi:hypothetical protein